MPDTYDEIMKFEGVGEKIALLYIGVAFGNVELFFFIFSYKP